MPALTDLVREDAKLAGALAPRIRLHQVLHQTLGERAVARVPQHQVDERRGISHHEEATAVGDDAGDRERGVRLTDGRDLENRRQVRMRRSAVGWLVTSRSTPATTGLAVLFDTGDRLHRRDRDRQIGVRTQRLGGAERRRDSLNAVPGEEVRRLAVVVEHGEPTASGQERRELLGVEFVLGMKNEDAVVRAQLFEVERPDELHPLASEFLARDLEELAASFPFAVVQLEGGPRSAAGHDEEQKQERAYHPGLVGPSPRRERPPPRPPRPVSPRGAAATETVG